MGNHCASAEQSPLVVVHRFPVLSWLIHLLDGNNIFFFSTRGPGPDFSNSRKGSIQKRFRFHFPADFFFYLPDLGILIPMKKMFLVRKVHGEAPGMAGCAKT